MGEAGAHSRRHSRSVGNGWGFCAVLQFSPDQSLAFTLTWSLPRVLDIDCALRTSDAFVLLMWASLHALRARPVCPVCGGHRRGIYHHYASSHDHRISSPGPQDPSQKSEIVRKKVVNQLRIVYVEGPTTHPPHARHNGAEIRSYTKTQAIASMLTQTLIMPCWLCHQGAIRLPVHTNAARILVHI